MTAANVHISGTPTVVPNSWHCVFHLIVYGVSSLCYWIACCEVFLYMCMYVYVYMYIF